MKELGLFLKGKREEKGISLSEIAEQTKIHRRYLQAIEAGDFSALPGLAYARAFLRHYADIVGADSEYAVDQLNQAVARERQAMGSNRDGSRRRSSVMTERGRTTLVTRQRVVVALFLGALGVAVAAAVNSSLSLERTESPAPSTVNLSSQQRVSSDLSVSAGDPAEVSDAAEDTGAALGAVDEPSGDVRGDSQPMREEPGVATRTPESMSSREDVAATETVFVQERERRAFGASTLERPQQPLTAADVTEADLAAVDGRETAVGVEAREESITPGRVRRFSGVRGPGMPPGAARFGLGDFSAALPKENGVMLDVEVRRTCWFEVMADGQLIFTGVLEPGTSVTWQAVDRLRIKFGRPEGVRLTLNGTYLGAAGTGVITREFTSENGGTAGPPLDL